MRSWTLLSVFASAVALQTSARLVAPGDMALRAYRLRQMDAAIQVEEQVETYYGQGGFPKQGRSLKEKIKEAERFLEKEIPKSGIVGVGAAIVYQDQVVLSKGFGLLQANDSSLPVTEKSLFQIGSVSKTMIAVAIGLLVEERKVGWRDPVKKHLPWLQLYDKYAEQHVNIGDLLSMNSGFGALPDIPDVFGAFASEREYIEALQYMEPEYSLREHPDYANVNFVILGQLIESVSGQPWHEFLKTRIWEPLGMNNTYASAQLAPSGAEFNSGHFACDGEVLGPFDITKDRATFLKGGNDRELNAAGSIISSLKDMATFIRLLLNKGIVDDVKLLRSASTVAEMITGKNLASVFDLFPKMGLHYAPDGSTLSAGYGIDIIGKAIWGYPYFDKSGDVATHQTRTGFAPTENLGVIFMGNSQAPDAHVTFYIDHYRTYVMGIFLDVPKKILDFEYQKWRTADKLKPPLPGAPRCGLRFWKDIPFKQLRNEQLEELVGDYTTTTSTKFFPKMTISQTNDSQLTMTLALSSGPLHYLGDMEGDSSTKLFLAKTGLGPIVLPASVSATGQYSFNVGVSYQKQS